jgi:probable F420-dependent oxidoreductase
VGLARLAGEIADGFHVHPFHSPRYLREVLLPAINQGTQNAGRQTSDVNISVSAFAASTPEDKNFARMQIAFYASTPSYRPVFSLHGWEEIAKQLSKLASRGKWGEMGELVDDEILETVGVVAAPGELGTTIKERYQGLADRLTLYIPYNPGERDDFWKNLIAEIKP